MESITKDYGIILDETLRKGTREEIWETMMTMDFCGGGVVKGGLDGTGEKGTVLQIDEFQDASLSDREAARLVAAGGRGWAKGSKRVLKLWLTDGLTKILACETNPIPALDNISPGSKVLVKRGEATIRHNVMILPASTEFLGGEVTALASLDAQHWKTSMLNVVGKPYLKEGFVSANPEVAGSGPSPPGSPPVQIKQKPATPSPPSRRQRALANQTTLVGFVERRPFSEEKETPVQKAIDTSSITPGFVYLVKLRDAVQKGLTSVTVRAYLVNISGVMRYHEGVYELHVIIDDGTGKVHCKVEDKVVQGMLGVSASQLKHLEATGDPRFATLTGSLQDQLEFLGARSMLLSLPQGSNPLASPVITSLEASLTLPVPVREAVLALSQRLQNSRDQGAKDLAKMAAMRTA